MGPACPRRAVHAGERLRDSQRRLIFLSLDTSAVVRPWLWEVGTAAPRLLSGLHLSDGLVDPPVALWGGPDRALFRIRDDTTIRASGPLFFKVNRGRNAAETFTALYRQDKRVQLVRYAGEDHTIACRANVLDLWRRLEAWLGETMAPGRSR